MPPKPDPKKIEGDRLSGFLQELLREEENKYCADCESKQPRWASWNLGVFLCIRCAGLHRNLGVHISKVKSVNLDSWTAEQVQSMRVMGNAKAKAVYEAELPQMFRRPQSDQTLEAFIRAKYEARRYILRDWQPPPVIATDLPDRAGLGPAKTIGVKAQLSSANAFPMRKLSPKAQETQKTLAPSAVAQSSLLIDFSAPAESATTQPAQPTAGTGLDSSIFGEPLSAATAGVAVGGRDLTFPATPSGGDLDDLIYGPIVSAPSAPLAPPAAVVPNSTISPLELLEQGNNNNNGPILQPQPKKKSTGDILALFGSGRPALAAENGGTGFMTPSPLQFHQSSQPTNPYGQAQAAMPFGQAQPAMPFGQMSTGFGGISVPSAVSAGMPPAFASFGAPPTTTTNGGGLDDLLGQFKL